MNRTKICLRRKSERTSKIDSEITKWNIFLLRTQPFFSFLVFIFFLFVRNENLKKKRDILSWSWQLFACQFLVTIILNTKKLSNVQIFARFLFVNFVIAVSSPPVYNKCFLFHEIRNISLQIHKFHNQIYISSILDFLAAHWGSEISRECRTVSYISTTKPFRCTYMLKQRSVWNDWEADGDRDRYIDKYTHTHVHIHINKHTHT